MFIVALWIISLAFPAWAQEKAWEREWNQLITGAKREGKVVVSGTTNPGVRRELPLKFKARFGITLEYIGGRSSELAARLRNERRSGLYTLDVAISGAETAATIFYPEKMLDPLSSALIVPEVLDKSKWKAAKLWFIDPEQQYILRLISVVGEMLFVNSRYVKPEEFRSMRDLLHPKWKGKILAEDPTVPGNGAGGRGQGSGYADGSHARQGRR